MIKQPEPQPLSEDLNKNDKFHHASDVYSPEWPEWKVWEEETELNPVEEDK